MKISINEPMQLPVKCSHLKSPLLSGVILAGSISLFGFSQLAIAAPSRAFEATITVTGVGFTGVDPTGSNSKALAYNDAKQAAYAKCKQFAADVEEAKK